MCGIGFGQKEELHSQQWRERRAGDRKFMPDGFLLLSETGAEGVSWRSKGDEVGRGETEVWKSSCVEGDKVQAQGSLRSHLVMWRDLEAHISVDANWQVGDFSLLHGSSQGGDGEEASGKVTQVCWLGGAGRKGREDTEVKGQGGHPSGQRRGWNRCGQLGPSDTHPKSWQGCQWTPL